MSEARPYGTARADWEARIGRRSDAAVPWELPRLPVPAQLTAFEGRGQVTLSWALVPGAAGYLVQRADDADGPFRTIVVGEPNVPPIPDTHLTDASGVPGQPAWYRVAAAASVDDAGQPFGKAVRAVPLTAGGGNVALTVDAGRITGRLERPWRPMIGSEHLSLLDYGPGPGGVPVGESLAAALSLAHDELGVEAVRAHAILHDSLGVYREVDGQPRHDFGRIGAIYDRLLGIGLRPIVEIGFMPHDLARDPQRTVFAYEAIVSPPRDWERWRELVSGLVAYLVDRYGIEEVRRWGFEVWNEANLEVFWSGTRDEYLLLYDVTARAVKAVDASLTVGGPASAAAGWIDELLAHLANSGAPIDFLSTHCYGTAPLDLRPIAARHGFDGLRLWWTEWGAHATHFNPLHDSAWAAAYLVRGMRSAMGRVESLAYWVASDEFEELGWPPRLLHGGFGLLTVGNLRKPRYWAMWMLERLGDERVPAELTGDGAGDMVDALATRAQDGRIAILAWNLAMDSAKADGDALLDRVVTLRLQGLGSKRYRLRHRRVDVNHSNLALRWRAMGAADWPTDDQWQQLREADRLEDLEEPRIVMPGNGGFELRFALPMPAVSLLELEPVGNGKDARVQSGPAARE